MHFVDRGPEPARLNRIRKKRTPSWVRYYRKGQDAKPTDSDWWKFQPDLERVFFSLCGYCEEPCKGEVDHFRPKSAFPESVYSWDNWVLSCHTCNHHKGENWPRAGYVDSCNRAAKTRPERFFAFDLLTMEMVPRKGLSRFQNAKARQMIADLKLNE